MLVPLVLGILAAAVGVNSSDFQVGLPVRYPDQDGCYGENDQECGFGLQIRCCPTGSFCRQDHDAAYCCATEDDACGPVIEQAPRCARPTWSMWESLPPAQGTYCCDQGYYAWFSGGNGVGCEKFGASLDDTSSSTVASLAIPTTPSTCTPTVSANATITVTAAAVSGDHAPDPSKAVLSAEAVAGIGVGCAAAGAGLLGVAVILLGLRSKANGKGSPGGQYQQHHRDYYHQQKVQDFPAELHAKEIVHELGESHRY